MFVCFRLGIQFFRDLYPNYDILCCLVMLMELIDEEKEKKM